MRWMGGAFVTCAGEQRCIQGLRGETRGRPLGKPRRIWEDNIKNISLRSWMKRAVDNEQKRKQKQPETTQILLHRPFLGLKRCGKHEMLTLGTNYVGTV